MSMLLSFTLLTNVDCGAVCLWNQIRGSLKMWFDRKLSTGQHHCKCRIHCLFDNLTEQNNGGSFDIEL